MFGINGKREYSIVSGKYAHFGRAYYPCVKTFTVSTVEFKGL